MHFHGLNQARCCSFRLDDVFHSLMETSEFLIRYWWGILA